MKTKLLTILCALGLSLNAHAIQAPKIIKDGPETPPLRHAKVRAQVLKIYKAQKPDGTYEVKVEQICDVRGDTPVFDKTEIKIDPSKVLKCETDLKIGRATVNILSMINLLEGADYFGDGNKENYKAFAASVWIQSKDGSYARTLPFTYAATGDMNAKVMLLQTSGERITSDQENDKVLDEQITVAYKFED